MIIKLRRAVIVFILIVGGLEENVLVLNLMYNLFYFYIYFILILYYIMRVKFEHILIVIIILIGLHLLMNRCGCNLNNGFSVGIPEYRFQSN